MSTTPVGVIGEFKDVNALLSAAETIRDAGYRRWDVYTPYPVHGLDKAMGVKRSIISYISFLGMVGGLTTALGMQWWMNGWDYKLNIGGKEFFNWQFSIPIDFELTVLGTAFFTFFGLLGLCKLPTWFNKYQADESFQKSNDDTYVITIDSNDDRFNSDHTPEMMRRIGAANVHLVSPTAI